LLRAVGAGALYGAFEAARNGLLAPGEWLQAIALYAAVLGASGFVVGVVLLGLGRFRPGLHWDRSAELVSATVGLLLLLLVAHVHVAGRLGLPMLVAALLALLLGLPVLLWVRQRVYAVVLGIAVVASVATGTVRMTVAIAEDRLLDTSFQSSATRDMNVVVILVDSLRPDHLGFNGYARDVSPTLDRMASEGRVFQRATNPGTVANWASIHASAYPSSHFLDIGRSELANLSELFRQAGWNTFGLTGHWHADAEAGFARGVDLFRPARRAALGRLPLYYVYTRLLDFFDRAGALANDAWHYPADRMIDDVLRIATSQRNENFLVWVHLVDLHIAYHPGPGYADRYQEDPNRGYRRNPEEIRDPDGSLISERLVNARSRYDGALRLVDDQLARLTAHLEELDIGRKTLIVVTSDHGDAFGEHGLLVHPSDQMVSEIVDVPLIFYWPGTLVAGRIDTPVTTLDILPTLAALAGVPVPESVEGVDLGCRLRDLDCAWDREWVFWDGTALGDGRGPMGITGRRYRYWEPEGRGPELYDLVEDPAEMVNLASSGLEIESRLAEKLQVFRLERQHAATDFLSRAP
jgi:arylsulfatase